MARQAIAAGAKVKRPVADQFYGDRQGTFEGGELDRRAKAAMAQRKKS